MYLTAVKDAGAASFQDRALHLDGNAMVTQLELGAIPENLLREPLEYIYADHFRQRAICMKLEEMVEDPGSPLVRGQAADILTFMRKDLPLHIADEEDGLFPLLRSRCRPDDDIETVLQILSEEHSYDEVLAKEVMSILRRLAARRNPSFAEPLRWAATAYIQTQRRHLSWENAVLLTLARRRLMPSDMVTLGRDMARRRGIPFPEPAVYALARH